MRRFAVRYVWRALGVLFFAIGAIGVLLPVMPTVPFWLLALWAFGKGSPRWRARMLGHPKYGPPLRMWNDYRAIPRRAKCFAIAGLVGSAILCSTLLHQRPAILAAVGVFLLGSGVFVASRPEPTPAQIDAIRHSPPPEPPAA